MKEKKKTNLVFVGAGKLAYRLAPVLQSAGYDITQVYSRTEYSASDLAGILKCEYTCNFQAIRKDGDIYFFALKDDIFENVLKKSGLRDRFMVHTAGSLQMNVFKPYTSRYGVFYPLQSFSKERDVDFMDIPICVEATSESEEELLLEMARSISESVHRLNSDERQRLHVAAVFANNFVNHMYAVAGDLLKGDNLSFDLLRPLIIETAAKAMLIGPEKAQTGPAMRYDESVIKKHMNFLKEQPNYQKIYNFMSESIFKFYNK